MRTVSKRRIDFLTLHHYLDLLQRWGYNGTSSRRRCLFNLTLKIYGFYMFENTNRTEKWDAIGNATIVMISILLNDILFKFPSAQIELAVSLVVLTWSPRIIPVALTFQVRVLGFYYKMYLLSQ